MKVWRFLNALAAVSFALAISTSVQAASALPSPKLARGTPATPSASAGTATQSPKLTAAQREFTGAFVAAVNSKNVDALRKLVMPETLACYDRNTRPYLDEILKPVLRTAIPESYQVRFTPFFGGEKPSRFYTQPAETTDVMQLEFAQGKGTSKLIYRVRAENGKLYLALPCLTPKGVEFFKAMADRRGAKIEKAREAYKGLQDPLRSQLTKLLNEHKYQEAFMSCRDGLKVDSLTARYVLELLAGREPGSGFATAPSAAPTSHQ